MTPEFIAGIGAISTILLGLLTWLGNRKRRKLDEEKGELEKEKIELEQVIQVNDVLRKENERLLKRLDDVEDENDKLKKRVDILEGENGDFKDKMDEASKGLAEARKQILELQYEIAVMKEFFKKQP